MPDVLLTGASGYVGGRLLRALAARGTPVRCLTRRPASFDQSLRSTSEIVRGDCLDATTLGPALENIKVAVYLVHSMGQRGDFAEKDRRAAHNFGAAAKTAGVARIVYLGALGARDQQLSRHLRSRQETGAILRESGVPVVEFRASIILGAGSTSFELVRSLTERLPVLVCPRWVSTLAQPIAVDEVIRYLIAAIDLPANTGSRIYEIGGKDQVSYLDLMREYARARGLRRVFIPVPFLTPWLSSLWLALVTPILAEVGRELIEGVRTPTVVQDDAALQAFPIRPRSVREVMAEAVGQLAAVA
ncbi:MAG TPA: NAD(P)H-binding protein [Candidatus Limnocylindrales bacterium]|nr:NAD(P)H-binding protein [Candidatus Limnocylindrales bacterium]